MSENADGPATGRCLCGAVTFEVRGPLAPATACHCGQCRQQTGHFYVGSNADRGDLVLLKDEGLTWYRSSDFAERGFCRLCGSTLFWSADTAKTISIAVGAIDPPTGVTIAKHIWLASKSDYYTVDADVPLFDGDA